MYDIYVVIKIDKSHFEIEADGKSIILVLSVLDKELAKSLLVGDQLEGIVDGKASILHRYMPKLED